MGRFYLALVLALGLAGCAGASLKRCDAPLAEPTTMHCSEQVQGAYRQCEKAQDIFTGCVTPQ